MRAMRPTTASQRVCLPIPEARYRWFRHLEAPNHGYLPPRVPRVFLGPARHGSGWTWLPVLLRTVDAVRLKILAKTFLQSGRMPQEILYRLVAIKDLGWRYLLKR